MVGIRAQVLLNRLVLLVLLALMLPVLSGCKLMADLAPSKVTTADVTDWLVVPVYFATNRAKLLNTSEIDFEEAPSLKPHRYYGVKNMIIPMPDNANVTPELCTKLGWELIHLPEPLPEGQKPPIPATLKVANEEMTGDQIIDAMSKISVNYKSDECIFFVHGCCATFNTSLERAAKISATMQLPLLVYDWVSPKGFTRYLENETLADETLDDFYKFLGQVEQVMPPHYVTLIGHSLGARFLDSVLVRRHERMLASKKEAKYKEVIFSNGDIDAQAFINHNKQVAANAEKVRVYINTLDGRLSTSAMAHGGHRLGRPEELLSQITNLDGQDVIDVTNVGVGHEMPFWVIADLHKSGELSPASNFNCQKQAGNLYMIVPKDVAKGTKNISKTVDDKCSECL